MKKIIKISLFLLVLSACKNSADSASAATETSIPDVVSLNESQIKNVGLQLGTTEIQKVSALLKVNGKIDVPPQNMVSISAPLGGYLKSTQLLPGSHVSRGEAIATIEDQQFIQLQQDYLNRTK
jgi:cobalt-zinc-cadmium efflux system membrane fusion protein